MSKINDQLEELMDDVDHAIAHGIPYSEDAFVIATRAAIIADWNTMLAALRRLRDNLFHNAELDAIIAKMEGNSPSRDEAMLEDKRYERDDIYKK